MNPTEKQDYIAKIQNLIESNEEENLSLALQLMEGLDLKEEVLSLYGLNKEHIEEKYGIFEIHHKHKQLQRILFQTKYLILFWGVSSNSDTGRAILFELIETSRIKLNTLKETIIISLYIKKQYLYIKSEAIARISNIEKEIIEINQLNSLSGKKELKEWLKNRMKTVSLDGEDISGWIWIRRKSKNPIEYQIQAYEENPEYSIFTVIVKVNI